MFKDSNKKTQTQSKPKLSIQHNEYIIERERDKFKPRERWVGQEFRRRRREKDEKWLQRRRLRGRSLLVWRLAERSAQHALLASVQYPWFFSGLNWWIWLQIKYNKGSRQLSNVRVSNLISRERNRGIWSVRNWIAICKGSS